MTQSERYRIALENIVRTTAGDIQREALAALHEGQFLPQLSEEEEGLLKQIDAKVDMLIKQVKFIARK